jgi:tRNA A-37 threonylcarbamoyl transferase component Bud32
MSTTMDAQRWQHIKSLLAEALERPADARQAFVDEVAGHDGDLHAELSALLAAALSDDSLLDATPADLALDALQAHAAQPWIGRHLGAYRIVSLIGRGGMGHVYLAERADGQYEQRVAIKLMREGADQAALVARFKAERQILASLDHPNLAKVLDGGISDEGTPYFVMEYVAGEPIDSYCSARSLPVEERLQLLRAVCQVVHYAHRKGVVHRDLKPANILVAHDGVVKLVDFGIAKRMAAPRASSDATATAHRVMTLEYASPEQVRGDVITPASDIFSLGVVMYRVLTDASPYPAASTNSDYDLTRAICDHEPPPPSRSVASRTLRRRLNGDLDAVVMMALRKDPSRRYTSAEQLADDVFRHLEGLPVQARRGVWSYRAGRFVLRHRAAVGAALVANLMLSMALALAAYQGYEAQRQRERAERHFAGVRQLANVFLFDVHEAIRTLPGSTSARRILADKALAYLQQLESELHDDPALQLEIATGYRKVGDIQGRPGLANLGDPQGAMHNYDRALALLQPLATPAHARDPSHRAALQELVVGYQRKGGLQAAIGQLKEAVATLHAGRPVADALANGDRSNRDKQLLRATFYGQLSQAQLFAGDVEAYLETSEQATQQLEALVAQAPDDLDAGLNLAANHSTLGEYFIQRDATPESARLALNAFRKSLAVLQGLHARAPDNTSLARHVAIAHDSMGWCLLRLGEKRAAVESHRRAVDMLGAMTARDPGEAQFRADLASAHGGLADALLAAGDARGSVAAAQSSVDGFWALPEGARQNSYTRYRQGVSYFVLGNALAARGQRSDRQAACSAYRRSLPILDELEKTMGIEAGNVRPAAVRQAMQQACTRIGA